MEPHEDGEVPHALDGLVHRDPPPLDLDGEAAGSDKVERVGGIALAGMRTRIDLLSSGSAWL